MHSELNSDLDIPIIAILRGITPAESLSICESLLRAGIYRIEIPLNSPEPYVSISKAVSEFGSEAIIGAGTVLSADQVRRLADIGARLIVSPNTERKVIAEAKRHQLIIYPGAMTPTEIIRAKDAGASGIKLFPARTIEYGFIKDIKSVIHSDFPIFTVGGIDASNIYQWLQAGADGVGVGSAIFSPGDDANEVFRKADLLIAAINNRRDQI